MIPETKKRLNELDIVRVIATILVVVGHCTYVTIDTKYGGVDYQTFVGDSAIISLINNLTLIIYRFHMETFMLLSGFLFGIQIKSGKFANFGKVVSSKAKRLLIPYVCVTLLWSVPIKYISGYYAESKSLLKDIFVGQLLSQGNSHLWFLPVLFFLFIIVYFVEKLPKKIWKIAVFLVLYALKEYVGIVVLSNIMKYLLWFYIGVISVEAYPKIKEFFSKKKLLWIESPVIFLGLCAVYGKADGFIPSDNAVITAAFKLVMSVLMAFSGVIMTWWISVIISEKLPLTNKFFSELSADSFGIYLYSDTLNYLILFVFFNKIFPDTVIGTKEFVILYILRTVLTFFAALAVEKTVKTVKNKLFNKCSVTVK